MMLFIVGMSYLQKSGQVLGKYIDIKSRGRTSPASSRSQVKGTISGS